MDVVRETPYRTTAIPNSNGSVGYGNCNDVMIQKNLKALSDIFALIDQIPLSRSDNSL